MQNGLLFHRRQRIEARYHTIRFRATVASFPKILIAIAATVRHVRLDSFQEIVSPAVAEEESSLADAPERSCAEHIASGKALRDIVCGPPAWTNPVPPAVKCLRMKLVSAPVAQLERASAF